MMRNPFFRRSRGVALGAVLSACFIADYVSRAAAENWPRFRGPNGSGISRDSRVPVEWNESAGLLWKSAIPGFGNSSPVVWGNRLFVQSASADGKERWLLCLDASEGRILWTRSLPGSKAPINPRNTLASSTPATDGRQVYAAFWDGTRVALSAYDMSGNLTWTRDLGTFTSQHGAGASPIVYKDRVIIAFDQDPSSTLLALRGGTGEILWQKPRKAFEVHLGDAVVRATDLAENRWPQRRFFRQRQQAGGRQDVLAQVRRTWLPRVGSGEVRRIKPVVERAIR